MSDVNATLKQAISVLEVERQAIDRKIEALQSIVDDTRARRPAARKASRTRRKLTAAERRAISKRMKVAWAKRKAAKKAADEK